MKARTFTCSTTIDIKGPGRSCGQPAVVLARSEITPGVMYPRCEEHIGPFVLSAMAINRRGKVTLVDAATWHTPRS